MTFHNRARCLSCLIVSSSARWAFLALMARNVRKQPSMPCLKEQNEKPKVEWVAGVGHAAWHCHAGFFASFACNVRPYQRCDGHWNGDAMGASKSPRVSVYRYQERERRDGELL